MTQNQSENINELVTALAKAQAEMQPAIKDSNNPHFRAKFADLKSIWNACREPLTKNGLSVIQTVDSFHQGSYILVTTLAHSSGQYIKSECPIFMLKMDSQGFGAGMTYARKYSLSAICGISTDDTEKFIGANQATVLVSSVNLLKEKDKFIENLFKLFSIDNFEELPVTSFKECFKAITDQLAKEKK